MALDSGVSSIDNILGEQEDIATQNPLKTVCYLTLDTIRTIFAVITRLFQTTVECGGKQARRRAQDGFVVAQQNNSSANQGAATSDLQCI